MIRPATREDFPDILAIYAYAREFMKKTGNPTQWGDTYPERELLEEDVAKRRLFVVEEDRIIGVFSYMAGEDPTYGYIEDGAWLSDAPYKTVHRVASAEGAHGVFTKIIDYCKADFPNLRIDTHHDNAVMQHVIGKNGFRYCGVIYVEDGSARVAYQYLKEEDV